jgi:MHS family proline/betaine transporter-like MFS transporter
MTHSLQITKHSISATSLGNVLEWFDFGLFLFLAPTIGKQFFPTHDKASATLAAFSVFAAGFLCRPLGGILFGHHGDTRGRAKTLRLSLLLITLTTLLIGLLPTYGYVGLLASVLFTVLRLAQGFSIGGEFSGVMIYLAESAPSHKRGFITSFAATGANLGFLLATLTVLLLKTLLSAEQLHNWGWRVPFIMIGLLGLVFVYYRMNLVETPTYRHLKDQQHIQTKPLLTALKASPTILLKILGITCMSGTFYYFFFGYMPDYLSQYVGIDPKLALTLQSILLVLMLFLVPLMGILGDRFGRKYLLQITALGIILLSLPCVYLLQLKATLFILISLTIATFISSADQGNSLCAVVENAPADIRYSSVAFSYNLGMALFGGTAPLVVTLLTQHINPIAPAYYLMAMALISFLAIVTLADRVNINLGLKS